MPIVVILPTRTLFLFDLVSRLPECVLRAIRINFEQLAHVANTYRFVTKLVGIFDVAFSAILVNILVFLPRSRNQSTHPTVTV